MEETGQHQQDRERLARLLVADPPPPGGEIRLQLARVLAPDVLADPGARAELDGWLADLIARTAPRSDAIRAQAAEAFGWAAAVATALAETQPAAPQPIVVDPHAPAGAWPPAAPMPVAASIVTAPRPGRAGGVNPVLTFGLLGVGLLLAVSLGFCSRALLQNAPRQPIYQPSPQPGPTSGSPGGVAHGGAPNAKTIGDMIEIQIASTENGEADLSCTQATDGSLYGCRVLSASTPGKGDIAKDFAQSHTFDLTANHRTGAAPGPAMVHVTFVGVG